MSYETISKKSRSKKVLKCGDLTFTLLDQEGVLVINQYSEGVEFNSGHSSEIHIRGSEIDKMMKFLMKFRQ